VRGRTSTMKMQHKILSTPNVISYKLSTSAPSLQSIGPADVASSRRCGTNLMRQEICYALYLVT
jgi:hypothetical protein